MLNFMETSNQPIAPETEALVLQHGGPLTIAGQNGDIVMMRSDVYIAMLGLSDSDEVETLASVRRGLADVDAGRTQDLDEAFDELDARHES
jgi:PHD/YefM family antitoxin component YafN of YafNO toxin-antitoxin module